MNKLEKIEQIQTRLEIQRQTLSRLAENQSDVEMGYRIDAVLRFVWSFINDLQEIKDADE